MTHRERVLSVLSLQEPDRTPAMMYWNSVVSERFGSPEEFWEHFDVGIRIVSFEPTQEQRNFERYLSRIPPDVFVGDLETLEVYSEWNYIPPGIVGEGEYNPLAGADSIEDINRYAFPDVTADYRYADLAEKVEAHQKQGLAVLGRPPRLGGHVFEAAQRLRGIYRLMIDFIENRPLADYLLKQFTRINCHNAAVFAQAGVDILYLNDDIGTPTSMMISPRMWREMLKPRYLEIIQTARAIKPDIHVFYHSDGYYEPVINDLIEIGVNVIEPVQPDRMNTAILKSVYGDRLAFWGTVGSHATWAYAGAEAIRREVKTRIETGGKGGGLIIAPAYGIQPNTPYENILAFFDAVEEYG